MRARCLCLIIVLTILFLSACSVSDSSTEQPSVTDAPSTTQQPPAEPTALITQTRTDGAIYEPSVISILGGRGRISVLFHLAEDCFPGKTVTFAVTTNGGELEWTNANREKFTGQSVCLDNARYCAWTFVSDDVTDALEADGAIFLSVVIYVDGDIAGYGICEIGSDDGTHFALMRCETVIFPMQDGQLQQVTAEYVEEKLTAYKQTVTPFDLDEQYAKLQKAK